MPRSRSREYSVSALQDNCKPVPPTRWLASEPPRHDVSSAAMETLIGIFAALLVASASIGLAYRTVVRRRRSDAQVPDAQVPVASLPAVSSPAEAVPSEIGGFCIEAVLHESRRSRIYLARRTASGSQEACSPVAIKTLPPDAGPLARSRFCEEIRIHGLCQHPNIVAVIVSVLPTQASDADGRQPDVLAMEYVPGVSLQQHVQAAGPLAAVRATFVLSEICRAVAAVHAAGFLHRDLKPANVMLLPAQLASGTTGDQQRDAEAIKLLDFGLAASISVRSGESSESAGISGTPEYMSPEACQSPGAVDPRSDIYAIGCLSYFLLSGRPPLVGNNPIETCWFQIHRAPPPLPVSASDSASVARTLALLTMHCLEKSPERRPQTVAELLDQLQSIGQHE